MVNKLTFTTPNNVADIGFYTYNLIKNDYEVGGSNTPVFLPSVQPRHIEIVYECLWTEEGSTTRTTMLTPLFSENPPPGSFIT
jgi:hypothetical protein